MKKVLLGTFLILNVSISYAQIDTANVAFVSYWSIGDSYDFKVSKIKQRWKEGIMTQDQKQEYVANFTVIDSTETSYTISWTYKNDLGNTYNIPEGLIQQFSKYESTEIKYKTSEVGDFLEILNWEEIRDLMSSMIDDIANTLGEDEDSREKLKESLLPFKEIYSSKEGIQGLVVKELQYFHFPLGREFVATEPIYYEDLLPNLFGGNPIKGNAKIYFESIDFEEGFCIMKHELDLDPEGTKSLLTQLFQRMNLDAAQIDEAMKSAVFDIKDRNTYEYYFDPGVPHKIETVRESIVNIAQQKARNIEKTIIELVYN